MMCIKSWNKMIPAWTDDEGRILWTLGSQPHILEAFGDELENLQFLC
jgi:hypothetical protein